MKIKMLLMIVMFLQFASVYAVDIEKDSIQHMEQVNTGEQYASLTLQRSSVGSCLTECNRVYGQDCGQGSRTWRGPPSSSEYSSSCTCYNAANNYCGFINIRD